MKKADKILIVCIMIVAVVLCVPLFFSKNENVYASVYVKEKQVLRIDLSKDKTYVVNGKLGKVHIEVKQKKVRVTQEKSPHHYCSKQGYVSDANEGQEKCNFSFLGCGRYIVAAFRKFCRYIYDCSWI